MSDSRREGVNTPSPRGVGEFPYVPVLPGVALPLDGASQCRSGVVVDDSWAAADNEDEAHGHGGGLAPSCTTLHSVSRR